MSKLEDEPPVCPFQWGDRVDHRIFGFGTIEGEPVKMVGPIEDRSVVGGYRVGPKGWDVRVRWDDLAKPAGNISTRALTLLTRSDAKGHAYWANEFSKLLAVTREARRATDHGLEAALRPTEGDARLALRELLDREREAVAGVLRFLDDDAGGLHP